LTILGLSQSAGDGSNENGMKIRKFAAVGILVFSSFAANNVAPSKAELQTMYDKAFREFDANNFSEALKQLDAIDARQPDIAESQNLRGVILMREGIFDKAEAALHEALRTDPKFWNARFNLAEIPFLQKNWAEARKRFEELLSSNAAELQGEAAQLIQYKILLTYLLEGKENMVDALLAKFELSPDTPAVHYANAAIALQKQDANKAKEWMTAAEKNFSPQLNKLFAESLYEIGWLEKQAGQSRAALEITSASEKAAKTKAFARSRYEQAQQALGQRDLDTARKFVDEADASEPNQPATLNLRGEIMMEQKQFDEAEATFRKALKIDNKFRQAQYNLAQLPFKKKDYAKARDRFEQLFSQTPGGDRNQAAQLIKYKIYLTFLLEGKDSRAQKMMEQFQFTGDTPALYYAQAAWEFKHNNPTKANDWITSAKKIYSPALNDVFGDSFYDLGWVQSASIAGSPAPASETAAAVMAAQTDSSPAIEPSPIPGTTVAAAKTRATKPEAPASSSPIAGMEATTTRASEAPAALANAPAIASNQSIAAGTPARPEDMQSSAAPALSPTVETPVAAAQTRASAAPVRETAVENQPAPVVAAASATPATVLAPARVRESSRSNLTATLGRYVDLRSVTVVGLVIAGVGLLMWVIVPEIRRRGMRLQLPKQSPVPATGPALSNGNGSASQAVMKTRFVGGPRQVSLQLKASEPSLRRSLRPATKTPHIGAGSTITAAAPVIEPEIEREAQRAPEPQFDFAPPAVEPAFESVGPVIEQNAVLESEPVIAAPTTPEISESVAPTAPAQWDEPMPAVVQDFAPPAPEPIAPEPVAPASEPEAIVPESLAPAPEPEPFVMPFEQLEPEFEPIGQGQPVPYQVPVSEIDAPVTTEMTKPEVTDTVPPISADLAADEVIAAPEAFRQPVETPVFEPQISEPLIVQPTYQVTMPEPVQTPAAPGIRNPAAGGAQPASTMHTAVQLTFSFEIASMQLTPTFKMGALQLRPSSKVVTMRLAPSQQPQPAMNLQVTFEISRIQPTGGGLGTVRLTPSQQQRPQVTGSPSFTVAGLQLVSNFEAAPVQLTPSQSAGVLVTSSFQIATVEFSPSFEIASIVLNATSKQVAVQLPGAPTADGAPSFEISNLQLGASGDIGMMQINMLGQAPRR
jgi:tetratricopeptide (TPR) repeat protein